MGAVCSLKAIEQHDTQVLRPNEQNCLPPKPVLKRQSLSRRNNYMEKSI